MGFSSLYDNYDDHFQEMNVDPFMVGATTLVPSVSQFVCKESLLASFDCGLSVFNKAKF